MALALTVSGPALYCNTPSPPRPAPGGIICIPGRSELSNSEGLTGRIGTYSAYTSYHCYMPIAHAKAT